MSEPVRTIARVAVGILVGALSGIVLLLAAARHQGAVLFDMTAELPRRVAAGFYPPERVSDLTFSWTAQRAELTLTGLDRDRPWTCTVRLRGARPPAFESPRVELSVDGLPAATAAPGNEFEEVDVPLPVRSSDAPTRFAMSTTPTFVPGPSDKRALGVQVDWIRCAPAGGQAMLPPAGVRLRATAAPAILGAAAGLAGATLPATAALAALAALAQMMPLVAGPASYTGFAGTMLHLAVWIALVVVAAARAPALIRRRSLSTVSVAVLGLAGVLLYGQLLGLLHPSKAPIDAIFHAHRFQAVLGGNYFFTQPMPGGVSFPYAIALYVFAAPWARFTADHVSLLRIVVCACDMAAYLALYWLATRAWRDRLAGAIALVLAVGLPASHDVLGNANLTNEFGHAMSILALAAACARLAGWRRAVQWAAVTALSATAFLSHVSTIALLAFTLLALAVLWRVRGDEAAKRDAPLLLVATVIAGVLAVVLYYGHFTDVYVNALKVRTGAAAAAPALPGAAGAPQPKGTLPDSLPSRVVNAARFSVTQFGWPVVVLAAVGLWRIIHERRRDPAALLAWACIAAYVVFVAVGVMRVQAAYQRYTVEFIARVVLATSPAALLLAGAGASWGFRGGLARRAAAGVIVAAGIAIAVRQWLAWY